MGMKHVVMQEHGVSPGRLWEENNASGRVAWQTPPHSAWWPAGRCPDKGLTAAPPDTHTHHVTHAQSLHHQAPGIRSGTFHGQSENIPALLILPRP